MKTNARVVVIGGGTIGVSIAYHLAKYGWKDVVLVEKHELTSGSTWMAAGNVSFFHSSYYCTQVNMKSIEIFKQLEVCQLHKLYGDSSNGLCCALSKDLQTGSIQRPEGRIRHDHGGCASF